MNTEEEGRVGKKVVPGGCITVIEAKSRPEVEAYSRGACVMLIKLLVLFQKLFWAAVLYDW